MDELIGAPGRVAVVAAATGAMYVSSLVALRVAGRRTLAQMSVFDFVVTVALGSVIANASLNPQVTPLHGITAVATLLALQVLVAVVRRRSPAAQRVVDFAPVIIVRDGRVLPEGLKRMQMTESDLMEKLRQQGSHRLDEIRFAILEPTGELSVVPEGSELDATAKSGLEPHLDGDG